MLDVNHRTLFLLVFLVTIIVNFGVSLVIYYKKFGVFKKRPEGFLGITTFGFIEDAVILPIVNILTLSLLLDNNLLPTKTEFFFFLGAGVLVSIITHILFSLNNWEIWLMEEPWSWNGAGKWHMLSLAMQVGYLLLVGFIVWDNSSLLTSPIDSFKLKSIFVLLSVFGVLYNGNEEGIKLGGVQIKNRTW